MSDFHSARSLLLIMESQFNLCKCSALKQGTAQVRSLRMLFELFTAVSFSILEGDGRRHTLAHLEAVKYYFKLLGIVLMRKLVATD